MQSNCPSLRHLSNRTIQQMHIYRWCNRGNEWHDMFMWWYMIWCSNINNPSIFTRNYSTTKQKRRSECVTKGARVKNFTRVVNWMISTNWMWINCICRGNSFTLDELLMSYCRDSIFALTSASLFNSLLADPVSSSGDSIDTDIVSICMWNMSRISEFRRS